MLKKLTVVTVLALFASIAAAQDKAAILKPPKGSSVAIVIFEDLE